MKATIVIDTGFGDSGKGITVDYLASKAPEQTLIIRFSGGHQVGHTVRREGCTHTFSNFGAATLQGVPTFYSQYTTIFPPAILAEYEYIKQYKPKLFLHPLVMVTTPYDIAYNRAIEKHNGHGSCGVGFGATIERNEGTVKLYAKDLNNKWVLNEKLKAIDSYYKNKLDTHAHDEIKECYINEIKNYENEAFISSCTICQKLYEISTLEEIYNQFENLIFEGSQGVLLDQFHGVFPHVTRSFTTSKNALEIIRVLPSHLIRTIRICYVSRCYQTRHGNGPMSSELLIDLINNQEEANTTNKFQGHFRTAKLDTDLVKYAIVSDKVYHEKYDFEYSFVLTCLDQLPQFCVKEFLKEKFPVNFNTVFGSYSPDSKDFKLLK